jgi:hypothetical protein
LLPLAVAVAACGGDAPLAPATASTQPASLQSARGGSGLALDIVPDITLLLGLGGSLTIDQAQALAGIGSALGGQSAGGLVNAINNQI